MRAYTLITAPDTPACHKVRSYLRWRNVPFIEKPATSLVLRSEVRPRLRRIDVPLVVAADQRAWNDSRDLIDALDSSLSGTPLRPSDDASDIETMIVESWLDQIIAPAASFLLWAGDAETASARLTLTAWPERSGYERERLARMVRQRIMDRFFKLGFQADDVPGLETQLRAALTRADTLLRETDYLFGGSPTVADCSLFSVMLTLRETAGYGELKKGLDGLMAWQERISGPIGPYRVTTTRSETSPAERAELVHHAATEFIPVAIQASTAVTKWAEEHPGQPVLPNSFQDGPVPGMARALRPADAWLLERLSERIRRVERGRQSDEADNTLDRLKLTALRNFEPRRRVERRNYRFELNMVEQRKGSVPDTVIRQVLKAMDKVGQDAAATGDVINLIDP